MLNTALVLSGDPTGPTIDIRSQAVSELPKQGDTLVRIAYSSLNYKDGLAVTGKGKIIRAAFPFVPGIDLVGEVVETSDHSLPKGSWVIGTGWGIGEEHYGGYSQYQWLSSDWLVPLPKSLSPERAMIAGTAGLTAMIAVDALEHQGLESSHGEVLVTGASGGVGSFSVALLAALGYQVVACTGKKASHEYLRTLGASEIVGREVFADGPKFPMESSRWAGAIDSVGSKPLAAILAQLKRHASVAACGLAAGHKLETTVFPFILRGVNLLGVDSNTCPNIRRKRLWNRLSELMNSSSWSDVGRVIGLSDVAGAAEEITNGLIQGRVVVDVNA